MKEGIVSHRLFGLSFGLYGSEEIKKLSVKEITNPNSFDSLSHCTHGGLYDPALGPTDILDVCVTCGQKAAHCPGHMGHIVLPMPVYNPVLFTTLIKLLRGSCFECHRVMCTASMQLLLEKQMQMLQQGYLTAAGALEDTFGQVVMEMGSSKDEVLLEEVRQQLENVTQEFINNNADTQKQHCSIKNVTSHKQQILKEFLRGDKFTNMSCPHCKMPKRPLRAEQHSKVYFSKGMRRTHAEKLLLKKQRDRKQARELKRMAANQDAPSEEVAEDDVDMEEELDSEQKEKQLKALMEQSYLTPLMAKEHMRRLWKNDRDLLRHVMGALNVAYVHCKHPTDVFFLDIMPVCPSRFRPVASMRGMKFDNPQTANLSRVVASCQIIKQLLIHKNEKLGQTELDASEKLKAVRGDTHEEKLYNAWLELQVNVNCVVDSDLDKLSQDKQIGIKQILEKKEGLFRKHMMGKRVNFAARSVISPDPFINTNEIGIPHVFATALTYPEPVTPWNFQQLKQAVINGPNVHPGACFVENEDGFVVRLSPTDKLQREAIAKQLLTPSANASASAPNKKVLRHLRNGDVLLLNRQPTLHKPSIQAHRARILPGEKTLRLHYANCKAYNADFDGDEMNAHFPQNEIGRAEAYNIASTDHNYLVPKDGAPLAGLIQDHMIGGVTLTMRGRFFPRADYQGLVYAALTDKMGPVHTLPPTLIKPQRLWSGKQVLSTVLLNVIPKGKAPLNITGKAKISHKNWVTGKARPWLAGGTPFRNPEEMSESEVVIHRGELLVGVLDKAHYGNTPYGLVHSVYELYGGGVAGQLLTALAKLFTCFLQRRGFTLGVADILCTETADVARRHVMHTGTTSGPQVAAKALGLSPGVKKKELKRKLREAHFERGGEGLKDLDLSMKGKTDDIGNDIVKNIMPDGLNKRFPENNLQLMVQAGAKGSTVNCMQISCLLGQIELEGRRPPLMISGHNLPSFEAYDTSPRAGGFIDGRFLTGIRPQEYFFHCMAGREGLVDTAVKTSRSGYLQRCIVKHLEGLTVNYDLSVRDADGSIVQFNYGEDSLDILKTQFLKQKQFPFLINNKDAVISDEKMRELLSKVDKKKADKHIKKVSKWKKRMGGAHQMSRRISNFLVFSRDMHEAAQAAEGTETNAMPGRTETSQKICDTWRNIQVDIRKSYNKWSEKCPDPVLSCQRPDRHFGAITETLDKLIDHYTSTNSDKLLCDDGDDSRQMSRSTFRTLICLRYMEALSPPGDPVGLIAAQSIGEPSTQMTLNTFHFAGRGEMNVTLGIPRLREILMVASSNIGTPAMDIPVLDTDYARHEAASLKLRLSKTTLGQVLQDVEVTESLSVKDTRGRCRLYKVLFRFLPHEMYSSELSVTPAQVLHFMEKTFFGQLQDHINKKFVELNRTSLLTSAKTRSNTFGKPANENEAQSRDDDDNDVEDDDLNDGDATAERNRQRQTDERGYEGEEEEKGAVEEESEQSADELEAEEFDRGSVMSSQMDENSRDDDFLRPGTPPTPEPTPKKKKRRRSRRAMDEKRINSVLGKARMATEYSYDADEELWCQVTIRVALSDKKLDLTSLIEEVAKRTVVYQVPRISRAFLSDSSKPGEEGTHLKTEGVNIHEMYKYDRVLNLHKLYTNDIHAVANKYGIEAACKVIIKEMRDVFAAYGIDVDYHHLSLIADYMTFEGRYKAFNRMGLESNPSPLQKMSFETTMNFLKSATLQGAKDDLNSPSSRIVVGKVVNGGTGCFTLIEPVNKHSPSS